MRRLLTSRRAGSLGASLGISSRALRLPLAPDVAVVGVASVVAKGEALSFRVVEGEGSPDAATTQATRVEGGTQEIRFIPSIGTNCSAALRVTGGPFDTLPCSVRYTFDAIAAYVRFARTTLPKLEKAWAAPHRADPVKQAVLDVMGLRGDGAAGMEKPVPRCTMDQARLKTREVARAQGVALPVYLHMFDASTIKRIDLLVGRYLDRSDNFAAPDIKPCME